MSKITCKLAGCGGEFTRELGKLHHYCSLECQYRDMERQDVVRFVEQVLGLLKKQSTVPLSDVKLLATHIELGSHKPRKGQK